MLIPQRGLLVLFGTFFVLRDDDSLWFRESIFWYIILTPSSVPLNYFRNKCRNKNKERASEMVWERCFVVAAAGDFNTL